MAHFQSQLFNQHPTVQGEDIACLHKHIMLDKHSTVTATAQRLFSFLFETMPGNRNGFQYMTEI